jgi:CelD/BcsL family acetyltransferase involved in cellulose biosynthesis
MPQALPLDSRHDVARDAGARVRDRAVLTSLARADIALSIHEDIAAIEPEWRSFQRRADGTVFQTCEWLATWQRHVGARRQTKPAIVIGRDGRGQMLFLLPLAIERFGFVRRLTWLGAGLCDYNAPLLVPDFAKWVSRRRFHALWDDVLQRLRSHPHLRYDYVDLRQMPEMVGGQPNPMLRLGVAPHSSSAHLANLAGNWDAFYARRSSATRRHDRAKRQRLAEYGPIELVTATGHDQIVTTLASLMVQKARWFAEMGLSNLFERPGYRAFFHEIATSAWTRHIAHVSRLEIGGITVATNFGLLFGDCYYHVLASYDRESPTTRFAPGVAHLHELLRHAIGLGLRKFDFSIGDERYKHDWCDTEVKLYNHLSAVNLRGLAFAAPIAVAGRIKRAVKQSPALWSAVRRMRAMLGRRLSLWGAATRLASLCVPAPHKQV